MAKYTLLIFGVDQEWAALTPEQGQAHLAAHGVFQETAGSRIIASGQLEPTAVATTLRTDGTEGVLVTDGPFLETKEGVGGYYVVEAADLDEVIKLASLLPEVHAGHSAVEIRPEVDHG